MRIVEINTVCDSGSTGRIAASVARMAAEKGHDVYFAYGRGSHPADIKGYKIGNMADLAMHVLINFFRGRSGFGSVAVTRRFIKWLDDIGPDVLHLHNIHGFYINIEVFFEYIKMRKIPVIWTLHDCWAFTGQCAYFDFADCDKWKNGCHDCPIYRTDYPYSLFCDNSRGNYADKKRIFNNVDDMTIVTPSEWLKALVEDSFLKDYRTVVINNGIDTGIFRHISIDREQRRQFLDSHTGRSGEDSLCDKKIVLGVANVWSARKGVDSFYKLADMLPDDYVIVLIGVSSAIRNTIRKEHQGRMIGLKRTESAEELARWYNIADVYVNPTMEDNYPTTNLEAVACGTPVISYDTGGCRETLAGHTGVLTDKGDVRALADAIKESAADHETGMPADLDASARLSAYLDLFEEIDADRSGKTI